MIKTLVRSRRGSAWPNLKRIDPEAVPLLPDPLAIEARPFPLAARGTVYLLAGLLVCGLIWASLSQVDRIVTARGKIITVAPLMVIQPLEKGIIRSIDAQLGQKVKAGDVLATLDPTFAQAAQSADRTKLDNLIAESQRLEAEIFGRPFPPLGDNIGDRAALDLQESIFRNRQAEYRATLASDEADIAKLQAQLVTNEAAQAGMKNRLELLDHIQSIRSQLWDTHLGSLLSLDQARLDRLALTDQLTERINQHQELLQQLASAQQQKEKFISNWVREAGGRLTEVQRQAADAREQLTSAERRHSLVTLRAPADGFVLDVAQVSIGSVATDAQMLFTIVPQDSKYEADVEIDNADIARVRVGDEVRLKLEAVPFERHGTISGQLRVLTEGSVQRTSSQTEGGDKQSQESQTGPAYFRGRIVLGPINILKDVPADFHLVPGMVTTAEIRIGRRSVISYILSPIFRVFDESLREP